MLAPRVRSIEEEVYFIIVSDTLLLNYYKFNLFAYLYLMVFPIMKVMVVMIKTTSKPMANFLKLALKNQGMAQNFFVWCGVKANRFEAKINYRAKHPAAKSSAHIFVPEIPAEEAF